MTATNILTAWDDPKNVDLLCALHAEGKTFGEIATIIGHGVTRNAVIGKAKRMKLPNRVNRYEQSRHASRTINGGASRKGNAGQPGQAKAANIVHRIEGRQKAERARQMGKLSLFGQQPFRAGSVPDIDDGNDVTALIAFGARRIGKQCAWIPGDPLDGAMCCGKPTVDGTEWCAEHRARVYAGKSTGF